MTAALALFRATDKRAWFGTLALLVGCWPVFTLFAAVLR